MTFNFGAALAVFLAGSTPGTDGSVTTQAVVQTAPVAAPVAAPVIAPAALRAMLVAQTKLVLVDVRRPEEFAAGHIDGAILMPLETIAAAYRNLPTDTRLVVYCHAGQRSAKAVAFLLAHGYGEAVSLDGGFVAWNDLPR
jgi:rhodanese-related sulfurtransferase